jgi:hypothetical protein
MCRQRRPNSIVSATFGHVIRHPSREYERPNARTARARRALVGNSPIRAGRTISDSRWTHSEWMNTHVGPRRRAVSLMSVAAPSRVR